MLLRINRRAVLCSLPVAAVVGRPANAELPKVTLGTASEGGGFLVYALAFIDAILIVGGLKKFYGKAVS